MGIEIRDEKPKIGLERIIYDWGHVSSENQVKTQKHLNSSKNVSTLNYIKRRPSIKNSSRFTTSNNDHQPYFVQKTIILY